MWIPWLVLVLAQLAGTAPSYADDARGYVWTPDGEYRGPSLAVIARLSTEGLSTFEAGNFCILEGKLARIPKKPAWRFTGTSGDGVGCPDAPGPAANLVLTILDGPGTHAAGNASKIRVQHTTQKRRVNFSGVYRFDRMQERADPDLGSVLRETTGR